MTSCTKFRDALENHGLDASALPASREIAQCLEAVLQTEGHRGGTGTRNAGPLTRPWVSGASLQGRDWAAQETCPPLPCQVRSTVTSLLLGRRMFSFSGDEVPDDTDERTVPARTSQDPAVSSAVSTAVQGDPAPARQEANRVVKRIVL